MKVGIGLKSSAYTPEAYAYKDFLIENNIIVQLDQEKLIDQDNDINIYFMGIRPLWRGKKGKALEIHEYQSLSTGKYPIIKDFIKKSVNRLPSGRIFLNKTVHEKIGFSDRTPYIYRDMGVDELLFQKPDKNPEYDIVYSGSISGRSGIVKVFENIINKGFKLLVIGSVSLEVISFFRGFDNIVFTGRVSREELPDLYKKCRAGLNYTPDLYPLNIQTSTKTLEYLASGLFVVSNRYRWAEDFFFKTSATVIWLHELNSAVFNDTIFNEEVSMRKYSWAQVLEESNFLAFIKSF